MRADQPAPQGKIKSLGILAIGSGLLMSLLSLGFRLFFQPLLSGPAPELWIPLTIASLFAISGILTLRWRGKPIVLVTAFVVVIGFAVDLFIGFNPLKAILFASAALMVINTATLALSEAEADIETLPAEQPATA